MLLGYEYYSYVTPCVGVWIETFGTRNRHQVIDVTPCVGVWIETAELDQSRERQESHPAWVCGLKQWRLCSVNSTHGHTLRGCVD